MLQTLSKLEYPHELQPYINVLEQLITHGTYQSAGYTIELYIGDARAYIKRFENHFDIVYQDAFSPEENPMLWTREYFADIRNAIKEEGIISTYSTALKTRLALYENGFRLHLLEHETCRNSTLAFIESREGYKELDMLHKIACNPAARALRD